MKLGRCILWDERVKSGDLYVTAEEGYAHTYCLKEINSARGIQI